MRETPNAMSIPASFNWKDGPLAAIDETKREIEALAKERFEQEQSEHQAELLVRAEKETGSCKKDAELLPRPPLVSVRSHGGIRHLRVRPPLTK
jgi:hypothetical protein